MLYNYIINNNNCGIKFFFFLSLFLIIWIQSTTSFSISTSTSTRSRSRSPSSSSSFVYRSILNLSTNSRSSRRYRSSSSSLSSSSQAEAAEDRNVDNYMTMLSCSEVAKQEFHGKSVLLTGASGGLGRELAIELGSSCNVSVLILSGRNVDALQKVKNDIISNCQQQQSQSSQPKIHIIPCDLSDKESVQNLGQKALEVCNDSTIDILINNGGVSSRSDFIDTTLDVDERIMQINFFSGVALCKMLVPNMIKNNNNVGGGKIIWISSVQGLIGIPSRTSYAASKFAVQGYCESLRSELATSNIDVYVISPGYIKTNLSKSAIKGDGTLHGQMDDTTSKGALPKDVAIQIINKVALGYSDIIVAATSSAKIAIWMKLLCPGLLQKVLIKRYEKSKKQIQNKEKEE